MCLCVCVCVCREIDRCRALLKDTQQVSILDELTAFEKFKIAEAMEVREAREGEVVCVCLCVLYITNVCLASPQKAMQNHVEITSKSEF